MDRRTDDGQTDGRRTDGRTTDAKWWQKLTWPLARWANKKPGCYKKVSKILIFLYHLDYLCFQDQVQLIFPFKRRGCHVCDHMVVGFTMQSVPITTQVMSLNTAHDKVYFIQHFVLKFVSDCGRSIVFSEYFGFRYIWNIFESGTKYHNTLQQRDNVYIMSLVLYLLNSLSGQQEGYFRCCYGNRISVKLLHSNKMEVKSYYCVL